MSDYKEILTSDRVYKKYKSIIPETKSQGLFHQIHKQVTFC